ncbi:unnamed protein product, partial [Rotaria sp. Silwood2]
LFFSISINSSYGRLRFVLLPAKSREDNDDNDLIGELSWILANSFVRTHVHSALGYNATELYSSTNSVISKAVNKAESLLYYVRYEPVDKLQAQSSSEDPKYKYINRIIAVNLRQDHFDVIGIADLSRDKKFEIIVSLIKAGHDIYKNYLEKSITDKIKLEYLLTNKHQILYLSVGCVLPEFYDQGVYTWFRPLVMEHIQSRYHFKRAYGISLSPASTHVLQKDGYKCIGKISAKMFECPEKSENYPFTNMVEGQDEVSILEKIFVHE